MTTTSPFDLESSGFFSRFKHESERIFAQNLFNQFNARESIELLSFPVESDELNLLYSISALKEFLLQNWLGPRTPFNHPLFDYFRNKTAGKTVLSLVIDGEYPYRLTRQPELLIFALDRLTALSSSSADRQVAWWYARALYLHQRVVDYSSPTLRSKITSTLKTKLGDMLTAQEAVEAANFAQECEDEKLAQFYLDEASRLAGIKHSFIGKLGRRTIHQTFDIYQLTVNITRQDSQKVTCCSEADHRSAEQPKNVSLNDDVLRESVTFTEPDNGEPSASHLELAILLANARQLWRFHARDAEINEKLEAYIHKTLESPNSWQIYSAGLFWRSKIEADRGRTMERACLQFKALAEQVDFSSPDTQEQSRFDWSFAVYFPTEWDCDREQGLLFAGLGAFKTALEIFERREMFEEAVQCLLNLGRIEDAQNVVTRQLEKFPDDPKLICVFGDVKRVIWEGKQERNEPDAPAAFTATEETYQRAWTVSGNRLAKAQRSLGALYYVTGDYQKVRTALARAVAINPLFESSWFLLGFSAVQLEDFEGALRAFTRLINLNQDNPEAWKHIANCHVKLGRVDEAHRALLQVTRLQFDLADGWLSLFSVSLSVGEPLDAIRALRRYIEILISTSSESASFTPKETAKIIEMTTQICNLVIRVCFQSEDRIASDPNYREMTLPVKRQFDNFLLDFMGQTNMASVSEFWIQVAAYLKADRWPLHSAQVREALLKAYRCLQSRPYDKDPATFRLIAQIISTLKEVAAVEQTPASDVDLMVRSVKRRCKEAFEGTPEYESL